jgi:hypothetical protein
MATDAIEIDKLYLNKQEQFDAVLELVNEVLAFNLKHTT